jgi:dienelactone hydrolase
MKLRSLWVLFVIALVTAAGAAGEPAKDKRLGPPKTLSPNNDPAKQFLWTPPATREEWEKRRPVLREQVLVANGLWPMPEKTPLNAVIHGRIERDGYTIEKVSFASMPGHYVTGNLYRPVGKSGKLPGVLFAHGHWQDARLSEFSDKVADAETKSGAEKTRESAKFIFQALSQQLARMGCVVFQYDMVGNSDSRAIPHRVGFTDPDAELRLQSFMGLQTLNSTRALDFLISLPDVDASRIGMTGASGGGTQTFILAAIDDRLAASFPAVMVSVDMQGGCICENCSYLRVGTGNIELAALAAPKPLGMSGANDWTKEIEHKGLPELKALYKLYGAENNVMAKAFLQFGHNYNQVSREVMYNFFNKHLKLGHTEPVTEQPFVPVPPKQLSVFDGEHPVPKDAADAFALRKIMTRAARKQLEALMPKDAAGLEGMRSVLGPALRAMITDTLPTANDLQLVGKMVEEQKDGLTLHKGQGEAIPVIGVLPKDFDGTVVVWIHPKGQASLWKDGGLDPEARKILDKRAAIMCPEVLGTGATAGFSRPVNKNYAGFTFGYNRPLLAERVHDILTVVALAKKQGKRVHLVGFGKAGPWVALARGLSGDVVARTAADLNQFRFESILSMDDEMMLPGALKYGGVPALSALAAPHELFVHNTQGTGVERWLPDAYRAAGRSENLRMETAAAQDVVAWLLR